MKRIGKPTLIVCVCGDWSSVIRAERYRDMLLEQKPLDEEGADYSVYRVRCGDLGDVVKAHDEFQSRLGLRCFVGMEFASDDKSVRAAMFSDDGWGNGGAHCVVDVRLPESGVIASVRRAIDTLTNAIR